MNWKLVLAAVFVCGLLSGVIAYAAVNSLVQIRNVGTIRAIGVEIYANEALTEVLNEIPWGTMDPGESKSVNAWVKNTGNDAQKLVMWTENWNPTNAQDSITLAWNYDDSWIPADGTIQVTFTLSVDPNITDIVNFSFDIWIKGVN